MKKLSGIYKITSPTNRVYIGQSVDIAKRLKDYQKYNKTGFQSRLKASFNKHGVENHKFEVIEECSVNKLNELERYWQEYYDAIGENGLNCKLTSTNDKSGSLTQEIKEKISKSLTGQKRTEEQKINMSNSQKGKKQSIETIQKRLSKISELNKDENYRRKFGEKLKKKVYQYDLEWNLIREYNSITEASDILDVNKASICKAIKGNINKTCKGFYWSYTKKTVTHV